MKTCTKCKQEKLLVDFQKHKGYKDGYCSVCRDCTNAYRRDWRSQNRNKVSVYNKKYYTNNPKRRRKRREDARRYYETHKKRCLEFQKDYYRAHKERRRAYQRGYYHRTKGRDREKLAERKRQKKMRKKNALGKVRVHYRYILYEEQNATCYYCPKKLQAPHEGHIDHMIPSARGGIHDETNLCLACPSCNQEKATMTAEEYMEYKKTQ